MAEAERVRICFIGYAAIADTKERKSMRQGRWLM